jgi:predicted DNA-binding transcriptional regulator AlpA
MIAIPPKFAGQAAVSPDEAAEILGISTTTFYRRIMPHVYSGTILSLTIGAARRIIVTSLLAWVEQETQKGEV